MLNELSARRLVVVTGKGGVGKSTMSAALAFLSEREGAKTLVCEVSGDERLGHLLGYGAVGPELTSLSANLWAVSIRPDDALREYVTMTLKFEAVYRAVFENALTRSFLRFIPSLHELVLLGKILFHVRERLESGVWRFDRVILDAPATGHAISFLSVPQVVLDTVAPGAMASQATWMRDLVVDPATTAVALVALPEDTPVTETLELGDALVSEVKTHPRLVILNCATAKRFDDGASRGLAQPLKGVVERHQALAAATESSAKRLRALKLPIRAVPRLFVERFDKGAVATVADLLSEGLAA